MPGQYPYEKRYKYPHLKPKDIEIWERCLDKKSELYESVDYDVAVGTGYPIPDSTEENFARDFKILSQYKIDVVGYSGDNVEIMEVKPQAGPATIGQVIGYLKLYKAFINPSAKAQAVILTDAIKPDMALLAYEARVKIIIV